MSELITLSGIFTGPDGLAIAGAEITVTAVNTGAETFRQLSIKCTTDKGGDYKFDLVPGTYRVTASYKTRTSVLGDMLIETGCPGGSLNDYLRFADPLITNPTVYADIERMHRQATSAATETRVSTEIVVRASEAAELASTESIVQRQLAESARDEAQAAARAQSFDELRATAPIKNGQRWRLRGWHDGTDCGGGDFTGYLSPATDDGGTIAAGDGWHWRRVSSDENNLNVTHFGAVPGGEVDCAAAAMAMFNWSQNIAPTLGIRFPAGTFKISAFDTSDRYIGMFRLTGAPVSMGYFSTTTLISDRGDGFMFTVQARMTEIANLIINGEYDKQQNNKGFLKNICIGGQYYRGSCLRWLQMGGIALSLLDTLDTRIDQFYSSHSYDELFVAGWSDREAGSWDHSTAIELTNFNIQHAYNKNVFNLQRATQSLMRNGWIEHSDYPGDLSNGHWIIEGLSIEDCKNPLDLTYARVVMSNLNLQSGASLAFNTPGKIEWLSAFERGYTELQPHGIRTTGSLSYSHMTSEHRLNNSTSNHKWFQLGTFSLPSDGDTVTIRVIGGLGYNANGKSYLVGASRHGNGAATLRLQRKSGTNNTQIVWEGEGSCPVSDVKYVSPYPGSVNVYIRLGPWVRVAAPLVETTAVDRYAAGQCFFWRYSGQVLTADEVDALDGIKTALAQACWSAGGRGIVIASDGHIALDTVPVTDNRLRIVVNGEFFDIVMTPVTGT